MSPDIIKEIEFLVTSLMLGVAITFLYDWLRILRRVMIHSNIWISIEDFAFWVACSIATFAMLYYENNGILRWFAVIGATLGMLLYKGFISRFFVKAAVILLTQVGKILKRILKFIGRPMIWLVGKAGTVQKVGKRGGSRLFKVLKNKLTNGIKLVKIILCKH